jgi:hypothetical protein
MAKKRTETYARPAKEVGNPKALTDKSPKVSSSVDRLAKPMNQVPVYRGENVHENPAQDPYDDHPERAIRRHEVRETYEQAFRSQLRRVDRNYDTIRNPESEFYAGIDPRRKQEMADGGLIVEDHKEIANLPRQAIHHEYPRGEFYGTPYIDDLVRGDDPKLDDDGYPLWKSGKYAK